MHEKKARKKEKRMDVRKLGRSGDGKLGKRKKWTRT